MTTKQIPRDAQVIQTMLKDMGIVDYEPRVVNQLLEFVYRYVTTVLDDAKAYANHAKKKAIDLDDVKLAVALQMEQSFTTPPPREILMEVARAKNSVPLPPVKPHCGIRLPPDRYCLSACNYKLKQAKKAGSKTITATTTGPRMASALTSTRAIVRPSSPAVRVQVPRPVMKVNTATVAGTKIQITVPPQAAPAATTQITQVPQLTVVKDEPNVDQRGIKRERDDDDYDAP